MAITTVIIMHGFNGGLLFTPVGENSIPIEDAWNIGTLAKIDTYDSIASVELDDINLCIRFSDREVGDPEGEGKALLDLLIEAMDKPPGEVLIRPCQQHAPRANPVQFSLMSSSTRP